MFVKCGDMWINPAHIESIMIVERMNISFDGVNPSGEVVQTQTAAIKEAVVVHTISGKNHGFLIDKARPLLDLLGIATRPADIIRAQIAEFVANNPGVEYGSARLVFGQGNLTDTAINQVLGLQIDSSFGDYNQVKEQGRIRGFLTSLLEHPESDRIAAMEAALKGKNS